MQARIAVLPGDGIGVEVIGAACKVLDAVLEQGEHAVELMHGLIGGAAIDAVGDPLPAGTVDICHRADAVLFGAAGGPKWSDPGAKVRPEQGLMALRKELRTFANLRPVRMYPALVNSSPIKPQIVTGTNLIVVRELGGGLYYGKRGREESQGEVAAFDTMFYRESEVERLMHVAFKLARGRRQKVTSVDKANVLESSRLWRQVAEKVSQEYPDVTLEHLLVDAATMHLISRPRDFDIIATSNMFGDILSDEASTLGGSMGMLPSASLGDGSRGLYEPIHGSAPDIAGRDLANPIAAILSVALLLRYSLNLDQEASAVELAVERVLAEGYRTADIAESGADAIGTDEMTGRIVDAVGA